MREIVLDTETTGLSTRDGDRLVEIAGIELVDGVITGNSYQIYINPQRTISEEASKVHGLTAEFLADKPVFSEIVDGFLDFIKNDRLVIHNADFDMKFLNYELSLVGKPPLSYDNVIDTLAIARKKYPGQSNTLDALCDRLHVDRTERNLHGALIDVELLARVYLQLQQKEKTGLIDAPSEKIETGSYNKEFKASRNFEIPKQDLENHNEFLNKIKNPLWLNN